MTTLTLNKKTATRRDVVTIPRREYEKLLSFRAPPALALTAAQKKALVRAERNLQKKQTLSYHELAHELGFAN